MKKKRQSKKPQLQTQEEQINQFFPLKEMPCELLEKIRERMEIELWTLHLKNHTGNPSLSFATAVTSFGESLRNWLASELIASSIVEEKS